MREADRPTVHEKTGTSQKTAPSPNEKHPTAQKRRLLKQRLITVTKKSLNIGLVGKSVEELLLFGSNTPSKGNVVEKTEERWGNKKLLVILCVIFVLPVLTSFLPVLVDSELSPSGLMREFLNTPCLVENNAIAMEVARPLVNCERCRNMRTIPVERDLTQRDFMERYAYTGVPVLVKGATQSWTAMSQFSFKFFKDLYQSKPDALSNVEDDCQFFPYKTDFVSLAEVLEMDEDRANFKPGQANWYIGWSNCHPETAKDLRKHYKKPYFLPNDTESSSIDWIFMGGTGEGANIHLDFVQRPSWQAQISGKKSWALIPSPECEEVCHAMNVTVERGDIIVVDTNTWYHSTFVHPGEISITIGSEYD